MSAVSERTLNWLYSVLTSEYHDVNRTYADVAATLSHYSSLKPRTEVYTYENGTSALLLLLSGTLPVSFRSATYRFPLQIWVPHAYPHEAPLLYVTPSQGMVLVPGNHVGSEGRVYHRYLAQWGEYWDRSGLLDFLDILRNVFAKEAPVRAAQELPAQGPPAQNRGTPPAPPVPPPPEEWRRAQQPQLPPQQSPRPQSNPPPLPPKPGETPGGPPSSAGYQQQRRHEDGPPLPPLPPQAVQGAQQSPHYWQQNGVNMPPQQFQSPGPSTPQRQSSIGRDPQTMPPHIRQYMASQPGSRTSHYGPDSPVSPLTPDSGPTYPQQQAPQPQWTPSPQSPQRQNIARQEVPFGQQQAYQNYPQQQQQPQQPGPFQHPQEPQQEAPKPKAPAVDLLTSPLEVTLPSQDPANRTNLAAPPIPPNPEKDMLLNALASSFHAQITTNLQSNTSAMSSLSAQNTALQSSYARLQSELSHLATLVAAIETNTRILHETMREADRVMSDTRHRKRPEVDEVLVAPTVVAGQLYREAGEVQALQETRALLGRGLDGGVLGAPEFVKALRAAAREEFLKKALIRKIGRGLGLDDVDGGVRA